MPRLPRSCLLFGLSTSLSPFSIGSKDLDKISDALGSLLDIVKLSYLCWVRSRLFQRSTNLRALRAVHLPQRLQELLGERVRPCPEA